MLVSAKKRRIPISDDIHIIIKKFRDKDKHDEKPCKYGMHGGHTLGWEFHFQSGNYFGRNKVTELVELCTKRAATSPGTLKNRKFTPLATSGDHDYDDEHSMDSEELRRVRQQEPSSSCVAASTSSSNSNSGTMNNVMGTIMAGGTGITIGTGGIAIQQQQQQPVSSQSDDIKLILKKLTNIEELLKVVAEQSFNRLAALKQEATGATTVVPTTAANLGLLAEPNCISMEANFKFPLRTLKELIELNKGICSDESLYNKLFEYLTKIKLECDENIVMNALAMIVSDEVLDAVTWDGGKKFKLSSLVIFSDSLYGESVLFF